MYDAITGIKRHTWKNETLKLPSRRGDYFCLFAETLVLILVPDTLQTSNFIHQLSQMMCFCPYLYTQFLPQIVFC